MTCVAPVVFDECGINLCREIKIPECLLEDNPCTKAIELKVIDIDFSIGEIDGSCVETLPKRPNCVRVTLSKLKVRFAAKLLDRHCRVLAEECFQALYLPDKDSPHCDDDTNPPSITIDLYAPYGVSYYGECKECIPCINYLGFVEGPDRNNELRQGIGCQGLAKVIEFDLDDGCMAVGLSLYLKTIYFIQYRLKHAGLCVPPKCIPINPCEQNPCLEFVEGDLLEQSIQPLELCTRPKTIKPCCYDPVEDPTPADEAATKTECDNCL
ncbi:hypothetical protein [Vallitalea sp.]|uniref:hypothetical protein n=1 Tax=Vallitalea sp. TaxID=1882829 RepID=UPI0025E4F362|nr:hypothetical protein [Vallitalea sp.]MCT4688097.1 hypothetical protein [Vallitalea sp.]